MPFHTMAEGVEVLLAVVFEGRLISRMQSKPLLIIVVPETLLGCFSVVRAHCATSEIRRQTKVCEIAQQWSSQYSTSMKAIRMKLGQFLGRRDSSNYSKNEG